MMILDGEDLGVGGIVILRTAWINILFIQLERNL